ncbi:MAG: DNA-directed RNA polymerase subunit K [Candidatus Micrarchaeota archaeon]|nr:DNA-directed RNA polymerase subunit K [Candidatus Micrarchaeota archaeon]
MELTRFEKARVIGARALQLASGAPPMVELVEKTVNPVKIAYMEFEKEVIPFVVVKEK